MNHKKNLFLIISTVIIISLSLTPVLRSQFNVANAQSPICDNGVVMPTSPSQALPVILIHGYREDSSVWSDWETLLSQNNIPFCAVSFQPSSNMSFDEHNYDACGSAVDHARDLAQIVQYVKNATGQDKVNIVGHSKGGLDARVYLANTNTADVANLVMIGTPNAGGLFADFNPFDTCTPAASDLTSNAADTKANQNMNTNYYTIAGECSSWPVPNDGLVTESSVESLPYSTPLHPNPTDCHWDLMYQTEYELAQPILLGR
jgi:pimeloyl-ACP methyl ester carboxylesterase